MISSINRSTGARSSVKTWSWYGETRSLPSLRTLCATDCASGSLTNPRLCSTAATVVGSVEPVTSIGRHRMHVGLVEVKEAMRDVQDLGIDLHAGDLHAGAVGRRVLPRRRAAGKAEDRDVVRPHLAVLGGPE